MAGDSRAERFLTAAVAGELEKIRQAGPGGTNGATFKAAASLGGFDAELHEDERAHIREQLQRVAVECGQSESEARGAVNRGWRKGKADPRPLPTPREATRAHLSPFPAPGHQGSNKAEKPRQKPPVDEVAHLWSLCVPVTADQDVAKWLRSRHLDPETVARLELARALPMRADAGFGWARFARLGWSSQGYRCVLPLYDAQGQLRSLRARLVVPVTGRPSNLMAAGDGSGLMFADAGGLRVLRGEVPRSGSVWVAEGGPDFLTLATGHRMPGSYPEPAAVLGLGNWSGAFTGRLDGASVVLATDQDATGDRYAATIAAALEGRADAVRYRHTFTGPAGATFDLNDIAGLMARGEVPVSDVSAKRDVWGPVGGHWLSTKAPPVPCILTDGGRPFLPAHRVAMLAAKGGAGKSWLLWQLAVAVATGKPWLGRFKVEGDPGLVRVACGEDDDDNAKRRVQAVAESEQLTPAERELLASNLVVVPRYGQRSAFTDTRSREHTSTFEDELREFCGAQCPRLVILDPASRFMTADAETDNKAATEWIEQLEALTMNGGPTVIVAHHTNKAGADSGEQGSARGSSALVDGVRWMLTLTVGEDVLELSHAKANDVRKLDRPLKLKRGKMGVLHPVSGDGGRASVLKGVGLPGFGHGELD